MSSATEKESESQSAIESASSDLQKDTKLSTDPPRPKDLPKPPSTPSASAFGDPVNLDKPASGFQTSTNTDTDDITTKPNLSPTEPQGTGSGQAANPSSPNPAGTISGLPGADLAYKNPSMVKPNTLRKIEGLLRGITGKNTSLLPPNPNLTLESLGSRILNTYGLSTLRTHGGFIPSSNNEHCTPFCSPREPEARERTWIVQY